MMLIWPCTRGLPYLKSKGRNWWKCASSKLLYGFEIVEQEIIILMEYISLIWRAEFFNTCLFESNIRNPSSNILNVFRFGVFKISSVENMIRNCMYQKIAVILGANFRYVIFDKALSLLYALLFGQACLSWLLSLTILRPV